MHTKSTDPQHEDPYLLYANQEYFQRFLLMIYKEYIVSSLALYASLPNATLNVRILGLLSRAVL